MLKEILKPSRIYPLVLLIAMIVVWKYRSNHQNEAPPQTIVENLVILKGNTMGTYYDIRYLDSSGVNLQAEIDSILLQFNLEASTWIAESEISRFNAQDTLSNFSFHLQNLVETSQVIHKETNGAFDPTVGPLVNAWGFGEKSSKNIPTAQQIDSLMQFVGFDKINLTNNGSFLSKPQGVSINMSAIAKGYGCDLVGDFLKSQKYTNFKVEIGGEVVCEGDNQGRKWRIGIEKPSESENGIHTVIEVQNEAMATSGNYRNHYEIDGKKYAHTINPKTGKPIQLEVLSASVVAKNCMVADAYATAFMVMGLKNIEKFCSDRDDIDVFIIYENNGEQRVWMTEGMRKRIVI